jgi:hypothetical protein
MQKKVQRAANSWIPIKRKIDVLAQRSCLLNQQFNTDRRPTILTRERRVNQPPPAVEAPDQAMYVGLCHVPVG